jgi:ATP-binding cassette subfamily B protein
MLSNPTGRARLPDERLRPRPRDILRVGRALKLVWSIARGWTTISIALTIVQGVLPAASIWITKLIVDAVAQGVGGQDSGSLFRHVALLIALAGGVALAAMLLRSAQTLVDETLGQVVSDHVTDLIHARSVAVDLEYYENPRYHDALYRAQQEAPYRPASIVKNLTATGQSLVSLMTMVALLLTLHWLVGLVVLVAAVPAAVVRLHFSGKMYLWKRRRTEMERRSYYVHWLLTDSGHAKEVRSFALGPLLRGQYTRFRDQLRRESLGLAKHRSLAELMAGAAAVIATFGAFAYIAWRAVEGAITVGMMVLYYQAFQTSLNSLQSVLRGFAALYEDSLFLSDYDEFMSLESHVLSPPKPRPLPSPMRVGLAFENVSFDYPDTARTALKDMSLTIRPGEVTALVGPNGSGKTTLVKLLCRLYDPSAGRITLDGINLRDFDLLDLRRELSIMFQDVAQYQFTARENISLGDVDIKATEPDIETAARDAGAHQTILGLRNGYDTVLGKWFEGGEDLSAGEWQKLALARCFLRKAQVLVLDEPAGALDPQAEWEVFQRVRELACDRAVLVISHRLSRVRNADHIYVFDQGHVVESGKHDDLLAMGGEYARMYRVQAET